MAPNPALPDDTRLWAALQLASGGTWAGCVYDPDKIASLLAKAASDPVHAEVPTGNVPGVNGVQRRNAVPRSVAGEIETLDRLPLKSLGRSL